MPLFIRVPWLHVKAITLFLVVFYVGELDAKTKQHELIHFRQQVEMLVLGFVAVYVADFLRAFVVLWDFWAAYHCIRCEQECHAHDETPDYLETRKWFAWTGYSVL